MRVDWYGQSAFRLSAPAHAVFIDPFGDMSGAAAHGMRFEYPAIEDVSADLLLVTHEHADHNGVEGIGGNPVTLRATAGTHESPIGEVVGIASEHDEVAGTERGPNTIFRFVFDGIAVAHFGDFGQATLRPEQRAPLQRVDLLFVPIGDGPTIGPAGASEIVRTLSPRWVVPMHYRTERLNFLETADGFLARHDFRRLAVPHFDTDELPMTHAPVTIVPAAP